MFFTPLNRVKPQKKEAFIAIMILSNIDGANNA